MPNFTCCCKEIMTFTLVILKYLGIWVLWFWNIWVDVGEVFAWVFINTLLYITLTVHSDFLLKVVDVMDCSQQKTFRGHDAPVLSLSFDPKDIFLVIIFSISSFLFFSIFKIIRELVKNFTQLIKRLFGLSVAPITLWYYGCNHREIYFILAGIS